MWVFDEDEGLNCRDVTFVPGLYKIFDEILGMLNVLFATNVVFDVCASCVTSHSKVDLK